MSLDKDIADGFAASHATVAARVLENLPEDEVCELLETSDIEAAASVEAALTPLVASRCLSRLSRNRAAEIVNELPLDRAADLLRRQVDDEREALLSRIEEQRRTLIERLLRYPEDTAGAMMEPRVEAYPESSTVDATLGKLRRGGTELRYYLYVVNDDLVLSGVVSLRELVSASPEATLRSIMVAPAQSLSARASKSAILDHPAWRRYPVLPVVDEAGRLVGVFRYETFRRLSDPGESTDASPFDVALALGELFWLGASGLLRGMEDPVAVRPSNKQET